MGISPPRHPDPGRLPDRPTWAQRRFAFVHPAWMVADFTERLRGALPRLATLVAGLDEAAAHVQHDGKWSIAQNIGHLADVEELWQERLKDLREGRPVLTAAAPARFQAAAARHPQRAVREIVAQLAERRAALIAAIEAAPASLHEASSFHERLQTPMRLVDCAQFAAEHDDHHLMRIRALGALGTARAG